LKLRLNGVDAPESGQPWGANSKRALSLRLYDRTISVRSTGRDRYGRTLADVSVGGEDVNAAMVAAGDAWAYRQYLKDDRLVRVERGAREARRGLWALPAAQTTAPWEWRAEQRRAASGPQIEGAREWRCGAKRTCTQMASCGEARFHLRQCSVSTLDSDGDGAPCEALCRS
jgi:endonuclease YncB( thermonuclease family)